MFKRTKISSSALLALGGALLLPATAVLAQDQRIEITGSAIKRINAETAVPITILKVEELKAQGVTTIEQVLASISAAQITQGSSQQVGAGTGGASLADLRGIGASKTLVLLNGRRIANNAIDGSAPDLNMIPFAALERVEVLRDGASSLYGTDAIGGVINFITRNDYQGLDLSLTGADTQDGGADKQTATIAGGFGDMQEDRYNVFGVLDVQHLGALRSSQRDFIRDRPLATLLPALMSSNTFPANFDVSSAQRNALITAGLLPAGTTRNRVNPSAPACNPPATVFAPQGPGGPNACSYDYMQDTEIYPDSDKIGFIGRGAIAVGDGHELFAEVAYSRADTTYRLSPNPQRIRNLPVSILPAAYRTALTRPGLPTTFSGVRLRMNEAGNRTNEVTSEGSRIVLGAEGSFGEWDYGAALVRSQNEATDRYVGGYVLFDQFDAGVRSGLINPFGPSSAQGQALIDSIIIDDEARKSKGVSESIDFNFTRSLMALDGGDMGLALGGEFRREKQKFTPSALLLSNNIAGDRDSTLPPGQTDIVASSDERSVASAYAELNAPISETLELQGALRFDEYEEVGSTLNPKVGLRWQPSEDFIVRASAGTGFRAPSLNDLHRPTIFGVTSSLITDPQCAAAQDSIDLCTDQFPVERRSNPDLDPERSEQFSIGMIWEPSKTFNVGVEYWNLRKKDVISTLGEQIIIESPARYNGTFIERDSAGFITNIILQKENQGELKTSGFDLTSRLSSDETDYGYFSIDFSGTLILEYERQFGPLEPFRDNLGRFLNDQVIQRWRHRIAFNWDQGPLGLTLASTYSSGYRDQNTTYDPFSDERLPARDVDAYSLWDLTGRYEFNEHLSVRAGVLNLLDEEPPFSNQAYFFIAGYDPTYTDPRGRSYYVGVDYKF